MIQELAIHINLEAEVIMDIPGVRPDGIGGTAIRLAITGIEDIDIIDDAIIVGVVDAEIYLILKEIDGMRYHLVRADIIAGVGVVRAVIAHIIREFHRAINVELGRKITTRAGIKEIMDRSGGTIFGETLLIEHTVEERVRIGERKLDILELDKDSEAAW